MQQENIILTVPEDTSYICPNINLGQLPAFLEKAVTVTDQSLQQDMLLLSALTACSYAMPNVRIAHGFPTHYYHPSLMTLVIAPPASGKGIMNLSRRLVMPIHEQRRRSAEGSSRLYCSIGMLRSMPAMIACLTCYYRIYLHSST